MILKFQRKNLIETSTSSEDSDYNTKYHTSKLMESKNPMIRLVIFGKLKKMINSFRKSKLDTIDRRLLRGLFLRQLKDFDEDEIEKLQNKSLLMRLKNAIIHHSDKDNEKSFIGENQTDQLNDSVQYNYTLNGD